MLKRTAGFTLIELLVTMVILAIIATVAVPGFGRLIESNRLTTGTNLLVSSIKLARTEAIKRGTNVTFSTDGGLGSGWCVHDGDATGDCASDQIRVFEAPGNLTFTETAGDLVFDRRGFLVPQTAQTFTVTPIGCASGDISFREVRISPVGRTEVDDGVCP
ncbi:GspH/FimT family pseudopilin [Marinobacter sp. 71-i]|uniref:Type II secretion system protein H n=1 Tax=Marinobacter iranensis TaxID=2962607 RepID=A0ABT5YBV4_9GAMM|nr:GspH/FimT family pseudopilin [Marinobacter iranensis]MDF0751170.1 GspH/FimT family pseudopilin [Marinobacter iranensis]